ncbi:hypothetical protein ACFL09_03090 [Planctomycetota bacterium]
MTRRRAIVGSVIFSVGMVVAAFYLLVPRRARVHFKEQWLRRRLEKLVGLSKIEVTATLGQPTGVRPEILAGGFGPMPQLPQGTPYDQWEYVRGQWTYLIWFADPGGTEPDRALWRVVGVGLHHESSVY